MSAPRDEDARRRPAGTPGPRRFRAGSVAGAAGVALAVGLGAGVLGGVALSGPAADAAVAGDLELACEYAEGVGTVAAEDLGPDEPLLWRLTALGGLTVAAGYDGSGDEDLRGIGTDLLTAVNRVDVAGLDDALERLRGACD